jgi:hypothetical protein
MSEKSVYACAFPFIICAVAVCSAKATENVKHKIDTNDTSLVSIFISLNFFYFSLF